MTAEWSVIVPEAGTNLVANPSVETATTGYSASGGSIAASTAYARRGYKSIAHTPTSGTTDGVYYGNVALTSGTTYTASVDIRGVNGVPYKLYFADTSGTLKGTAATTTGDGAWRRISVSWVCDSSTNYRIYVAKNSDASTGVYYIDGLMVQGVAYLTTYIDGDQGDGYAWTGAPHASTSTRAAWCRSGGRERYLDTDYSLKVRFLDGVGMPGVDHFSQEYSQISGGYFQGTRTPSRTFSLVIRAKGASVSNLHSLRKALINAIKPDLVTPEQPFVLRYYGNSAYKPLELSAVYQSGLEMNSPEGFFYDEIALRCIAYDPYWYEDGNASVVLDTNDTARFYYIGAKSKTTGQWSNLGISAAPTSGGTVNYILTNPLNNDQVYVGGSFVNMNGAADLDYIAMYTISTGTWSAVGTDRLTGTVECMAFDAAGTLYIGGAFTDVGGDADADYLLKLTAGNWAKVAAGATGTVYALAFDPSGKLYIGGDFENWETSSGDHIVSWDGSNYAALSSGVDDAVYGLSVDHATSALYAVGAFANYGSTAAVHFAKWDGSSWSAPGALPGGAGAEVAVDDNGIVYLIGGFSTAGGVSGTYSVAKYNGSVFGLLGAADEFFGNLYDGRLADGGLYVSGNAAPTGSNYTGPHQVDGIAYYNGSSWEHLGLSLPVNTTAHAVEVNSRMIFLGTNTTGAAYFGGTATATAGTTISHPVIKITRAGGTGAIVQELHNVTSGAKLLLDYAMQDGETLTIDTRPGRRSITSSITGPVWRAVLKSSQFVDFCLQPGANTIVCYVEANGSPTVTAWMEYRLAHWSIDGVAA